MVMFLNGYYEWTQTCIKWKIQIQKYIYIHFCLDENKFKELNCLQPQKNMNYFFKICFAVKELNDTRKTSVKKKKKGCNTWTLPYSRFNVRSKITKQSINF